MNEDNTNIQPITRETRVFILDHSKIEVEVFTYLKAREMVNITTKEAMEQTRALFNQVVVRIGDARPDDKYEYSLDELRGEDYLQIVAELTGLVQQTTGQKKTSN